MQGENRQAYDRGTTVFSPDGRLYQVEYARQAVEQGAPAVGVNTAEGVVLAAHAADRSSLIERRGTKKLHGIDGRIGVAGAGHAADTRQLVDLARREAVVERRRYGEPAGVATLSRAVADRVREHTASGGTRPFGTALLVAGAGGGGSENGDPHLFEVDPSGTVEAWRADAVGRGATAALDRFEAAHEPGLSTDAALELALEGLDAAVEDLDPDDVEAATVDAEGYRTLPDDRVRGAC